MRAGNKLAAIAPAAAGGHAAAAGALDIAPPALRANAAHDPHGT